MLGKVLSINAAPARSDILGFVMKTILLPVLTNAIVLIAIAAAGCANLGAAETNTALTRIGIYDSRAVAYAWFWSGKHQSQLTKLMQDARAAKAAGDTNRFKEFDAKLRRHQDEMEREVFGTAPPTVALDELKDRLPEIQKAAGVAAIVSKWNDTALKKYSDAEKVDVSDRLVREFITSTPQQQKVLSEMQRQKPLPLEKCDDLIRKREI
jgi:hypothetical protein